MKMTHSWDFLLWCDPSNYGGIRCATPKDDTEKTNPLEEGKIIIFTLYSWNSKRTIGLDLGPLRLDLEQLQDLT